MQQRFGVGVIGCGTIAQSAHLPAIARLRDRARLVAVADVRGPAAEHAARTWGAEEAYADYRALLERQDINVVVIATPEFLHPEQVQAAAAAGKHILCEKPMAPTVEDADAMIAAAKSAGVKFMVGHSRRFTPRYQAVRAAIDRGAVGQVRLVRENERRPRAMYRGLSLATGAWAPDGQRTWMSSAQYSLGAAMLNAIHEVDLLRWYVGDEVTSVYAESRTTDPDTEVPDFISIQMRFANGALAASEVVTNLPHDYPLYHHLEVFGTEGAINANDPDMRTYSETTADGAREPLNFDTLLHIDTAYEDELRGLLDAIERDTAVPLPPEEARQAVLLSVAAVWSSRKGQVAHIRRDFNFAAGEENDA
jgi:predicted dehydrogenase